MSRREMPAKWIREMLPKKCVNCGSTKDIQYHHIVPVIFGGNEVPTNVAVLCGRCHDMVHYGKSNGINHGATVKAGIQRARDRGVKLGRRAADGERVMRLIAENSSQFVDLNSADAPLYTENEIMEMAGVKSVCYHKYKRQLLLLMNADEWPFEWDKPKIRRNMPLYDRAIKKLRGDAVKEKEAV